MHEDCRIDRIEITPEAVVLRVGGRLDARSTPRFLAMCESVLGSRRNLVLNLLDVDFIASSGVGALLALVEDAADAGVRVGIGPASPAVTSVIDLLNLQDFLSVRESEGQALAAVGC